MVESLKALDPDRPIREADMVQIDRDIRFLPEADVACTGASSDFWFREVM
jgi:hypothetical protein